VGSAGGLTLLFDADDTLWENNIYFERAIAAFISFLDHQQHTPAEVREVLNGCERETIGQHGYGLASFRRSLLACFERLSPQPASAEQRERIFGFAGLIASQEIELLEGVAETLPMLAARHRLILVTKGNAEEQRDKLERSGVHAHFSAVEIPAEKNEGAYRGVMEKYGLDPAAAWMIGNSPRSDINPALSAGLNAVYIHHPNTWVLEHDALGAAREGRRLLELRSFRELGRYF
jgi:putative hydrolase of the HAD superfamily